MTDLPRTRSRRPCRIVAGIVVVCLGHFAHHSATGEQRADTQSEPATADAWPLFRGVAGCTGVSAGKLPDRPAVLWKRSFKNGSFDATAIIVGESVYVGSLGGDFYALDLASGDERWKLHTELGFEAAAAVREGVVYVGDADGVFYALDAATGDKKWSVSNESQINGGTNFYRDRVLFTSEDGNLTCLKCADGSPVWKYSIDNMLKCAPSVAGNRGFLAGCDGKLHVVDLDKGEAVAKVDIDDPTLSTPAASGERVYFGTQAGRVLAVDWRKAEIAWSYEPKRSGQQVKSSSAVAAGLVLYGGHDRMMHALVARSGDEVWSTAARANIDASPVVVGERVIVGTQRGELIMWNLKDGKQVWQYEAGGRFSASPAVAQGKMVIGNDAGDLYCFGDK